MFKKATIIKFLVCCSIYLHGQDLTWPDTVVVQSGKLKLKGLLWRPAGTPSFPAIIFCHGTYETNDTRIDVVQQTSVLGELCVKNGYVFLGLFRSGNGLSKDQGENCADLTAVAVKEKGQEERNKLQLRHLQNDQLHEMVSGLEYLRKRKDVDTNRIAVIGHSFGGSLALLLTKQDRGLKSVIIFGAGGYSWDRSIQLRKLLFNATENITVPVMIIHAQNDYSVNPGYALDSAMTVHRKAHFLKIYPSFGKLEFEGHNIISLSTGTWQSDVFEFLRKNLE